MTPKGAMGFRWPLLVLNLLRLSRALAFRSAGALNLGRLPREATPLTFGALASAAERGTPG